MELLIGIIFVVAAYMGQYKEEPRTSTPKSRIEEATAACQGSIKRFKEGSLMFECKDDATWGDK